MILPGQPEQLFGLVDIAGAVIRWAMFGGTLAAIGAGTLTDVVLRRVRAPLSAETRRTIVTRVRSVVVAAAVLLIACQAARLALQVTQLADGDPLMPMAKAVLLHTQWGTGLIVGLASAILLLISTRAFDGPANLDPQPSRGTQPWLWKAVYWVSVLGLATSPALTGHAIATADTPGTAVASDVAHVLAGGAWLGTLAVMLVTIIRRPAGAGDEHRVTIARVVHAFSPVALSAAGVITLTGFISGRFHVGTWGNLFTTPYGVWLTIKLALFGCIIAAGAFNWRRAGPRLQDENADGGHTKTLMRSATIEITLAVLLLAVTAVLVATPPSIE